MRSYRATCLLALGSVLCAGPSAAQPSGKGEAPPDFFRVYQYDQPFAGWIEPTLWSTYIASSDLPYTQFGRQLSREGLWAHSAELEYGLTDRIAIGGYADFDDASGAPARFDGGRLEGRYRFSDRQNLFFNPALYVEYYLPRGDFGDQRVETRLILDKDLGDFRVALNPVVSVTTSGPEAAGAPSVELDAGVYWRRYFEVQPGLEYYADYGKWGQWSEPRQYVFPVANVQLGRHVAWQIGAGFGLTHASDDVVLKSLLTLEFDAIRPSRLFGRAR